MTQDKRKLTKCQVLKNVGKGGGNEELQQILQGKDLYVLIKGAKGLRVADPTGASDPFCQMKVGDYTYRTQIIPCTTQPEWNDTKIVREAHLISQNVLGQSWKLEFCVYDHDVWKDDRLGKAVLELSSLLQDFKNNCHAVRSLQLVQKIKQHPPGHADGAPVEDASVGTNGDHGVSTLGGDLRGSGLSSQGSGFSVASSGLSVTSTNKDPGSTGSTMKKIWRILRGNDNTSLGCLDVELWLQDATVPSDDQEHGLVRTELRTSHNSRGASPSICMEVPGCGTLYEEPFVVHYKVTVFSVANLDYQELYKAATRPMFVQTPRTSNSPLNKLRSLKDAGKQQDSDEEIADGTSADEEEEEVNLLDLQAMPFDPATESTSQSGLYVWLKVLCSGAKQHTRMYSVPKSGPIRISHDFVFSDIRPVTREPAVMFCLHVTTNKRNRGRNIANANVPLSHLIAQCKRKAENHKHHKDGVPFPVQFDVDFERVPGSTLSVPLHAQLHAHAGAADHDRRADIYYMSDMLSGMDSKGLASPGLSRAASEALQTDTSQATPKAGADAFGGGLPSSSMPSTAYAMPPQSAAAEVMAPLGSTSERAESMPEPPASKTEQRPGDAAIGLRRRNVINSSAVNLEIDVTGTHEDIACVPSNNSSPEGQPFLARTISEDGRPSQLTRLPKRRSEPLDSMHHASAHKPPSFVSWVLGLLQVMWLAILERVQRIKANEPTKPPPRRAGTVSILLRNFEVQNKGGQNHYYLVLKCGPHWWTTQPAANTICQVCWEVVLPLYDPSSILTVVLCSQAMGTGLATQMSSMAMKLEKPATILGRGRLRLQELPINTAQNVLLDITGFLKGKVERTGVVDLRVQVDTTVTDLLKAYFRPMKPHNFFTLGLNSSKGIAKRQWQALRTKDLLDRTKMNRKAMEHALSTGRQEFSIQRIKAHVARIMTVLNTAHTAKAASAFFCRVQSWEEPAVTGAAVLGIVLLCKCTGMVLCAGLIALICMGIYRFIFEPPLPLRLDLELQTMSASADDVSSGDASDSTVLDAEVPTTNRYKLLVQRYQFLMGIMLQVQNGIDDVATALEKISMMLSWQDPRVTIIALLVLLLGVPMVWWLGLSNLVMLGLLYAIRPPSMRNPIPPAPVFFFSMLPSRADRKV